MTVMRINNERFDIFDQIFQAFNECDRSTFPKINSWLNDEETKFYIEATLAGYNPEDVDIQVDSTHQTITFESKSVADDDKKWVVREIKKSAFKKTLKLSHLIKIDSAQVSYKNGIVTVEFDMKSDEELGIKKLKIV